MMRLIRHIAILVSVLLAVNISIYAQNSTSTTKTILETDISIFPSPNNGLFSIRIDGTITNNFVRISIMSIYGKPVFQKEYNAFDNPFLEEYDFRYLPTGMYLIQVEINGEGKTYRMMIS